MTLKNIQRRLFLKGAGSSLALPLLDIGTSARAAPAVAKRFVVFFTGQGTLNHKAADLWTPPVLPNRRLELSGRPMLEMLTPLQKKMVVIRGLDNAIMQYLVPYNGHTGPGHTLLTAHLPQTAVDASGNFVAVNAQKPVIIPTKCMGPSIDHYLASKFGGADSLHLGVNGIDGGEYPTWYKTTKDSDGGNTPVDLLINPVAVFDTYISKVPNAAPTRQERFATQRKNVLDPVRAALNEMSKSVGAQDKLRLEQHASRISELQKTLSTLPPTQCGSVKQQLPAGFPSNPGITGSASLRYERVLAEAQIDNLVNMLACGARTVATLTNNNYDSPTFDWLATEADVPAADRANFPIMGANWHARVHRDGFAANHPILVNGFRSYGKQFQRLLEKMDAVQEPNGQTLLDNSLVLWISEFGDGGSHDTNNLPVVLAGGAFGGLKTERFLDFSSGGAAGATRYTTGDLYTSILRLYGFDEKFGFTGASGLNNGGLPGLL